MDIEEIKSKKRELQSNIKKLIGSFEEETGVCVSDVIYDATSYNLQFCASREIRIIVKLEI